MSTPPRRVLIAVVFCCLAAGTATAQETQPPPEAPANLAFVEGTVDVVHEGVSEPADPPVLLVDGDVVRTRNGRAEIVFADGSVLHLDAQSELEILAPERIRLLNGRALLRVSAAAARPYFVDTPAATVRLDSRGEYGVTASLSRGDLEVTVARGIAEIDDGTQRTLLRAGEMLTLATRGTHPIVQPFNSALFDAFALWSSTRINGFSSTRSAAQLPAELRPYSAVLDHYGRWDYVAPHGYVWFPAVAVGWRPYYDGWWDHTRYGWTWFGRDRWAWPTHHFGRWGFTGNFWYWIPARSWGPAWVSWGFAPDYVGWCPLGWDGYPIGRVGGVINAGLGWHDPWRSWTVVGRDHFGRRRLVRTNAINVDRFDDRTRRSFVVQNTPPTSPPGFAVPRATITAPGAIGTIRRQDPTDTRLGNVRRPQPAAPANIVSAPDVPNAAVPRTERDPSTSDRRDGGSIGVTPLAPGYRARPGTERPGETDDSRRGRVRSRDPQYTPAPPPSEAAPAAGAQPREAERSQPSSYGRWGDYPSARYGGERGSERGGSGERGSSGERGGSVRAAEPRAPSPRSEGARDGSATRDGGGARDSGGARPRGGGESAPPPSEGGGRPGAGGGAVRRPPG